MLASLDHIIVAVCPRFPLDGLHAAKGRSMPERVIACIGAKGGVGKSTIAISLSVCATDCLLVDTDPQLSAGNWYREREAELPELVKARAGDVAKAIAATKRRYVIIDTPPHASEAIQAVAALADQLLIIV